MALGKKTGGRTKGTKNKRTQGREQAEAVVKEAVAAQPQTSQTFDSLDMKRRITAALFALAAEENNKKATGAKYDHKWYMSCLEAADRAVNGLLPYEHRRLGNLGVDVEALMQRDGSLKVSISSGDTDL